MSRRRSGPSRTETARFAGGRPPAPRASGKQALELVALKGKDVIGVRHLVDGQARIGATSDAVARVSVTLFGGESPVIAEAESERFLLRVPPRLRGRLHAADGLARLLTGPAEVPLHQGDRAVLMLGPVQVRAQIVPIEVISRRGGSELGGSSSMGLSAVARWVGLVGGLYLAALAVCAALAPRDRAQLEPGALRRAIEARTAPVIAAAPVY